MTSQTTIDDSVFSDMNLSRSLNMKSSQSPKESEKRRRHKSADMKKKGVPGQEEDSEESRPRHQSGDMDHLQLSNALSAKVSKELEAEGKGSQKNAKLSGPSMKPGHSTILENGMEGENRTSGGGDGKPRTPVARNLFDLDNKDTSQNVSPIVTKEPATPPNLLDLSPKAEPVRAITKGSQDIFSDLEEMKKTSLTRTCSVGSASSNTSSPSHSVRTPVTENDPLGLFSPPLTSNVSGTPDLLGLNDSKDSGISTATGRSAANRSNLLIDVEPFSSPGKGRLSSVDSAIDTPKMHGAGDADKTRTYTLLKTSPSASSNDTSSPGSPAEAWAPLSQTQKTHSVDELGEVKKTDHEDVKQKSSTLPATAAEQGLAGKPPAGSPATAHRRGKLSARSESFRNALSSTAKSTASFFSSRFSSKFAELKHSMSPGSTNSLDKSDESGSQTSLAKNESIAEEESETPRSSLKKVGSEELLDNKESHRNQADSRSLDDTLDGTPSKARQASAKGYAYGE